MKHRRQVTILLSLTALLLLFAAVPATMTRHDTVPGLEKPDRTLLRIWVTSSPGGGQAWLTAQLRKWERQNPAVMTYLRSVTPEALFEPDTVLPDIVLFMPGDFPDRQAFLTQLSAPDSLREELLRSGRRKGDQYGLPLCWGGYVLAIDSALEPGSATTPTPATLLGKPAATAVPSAPPHYPLEAASAAACPIQSSGGAALFCLCSLLGPDERPRFPDNFAQLASGDVYAAFRSRTCATAVLTTGQATAFAALTSAGKGFPFRTMTPADIITDQVWLAGIMPGAPREAGELLRFLTSTSAQNDLTAQGLHTVRDDLRLYSTGFSAEIEAASHHSLQVINAFVASEAVQSAAWQAFQEEDSIAQVLFPLL